MAKRTPKSGGDRPAPGGGRGGGASDAPPTGAEDAVPATDPETAEDAQATATATGTATGTATATETGTATATATGTAEAQVPPAGTRMTGWERLSRTFLNPPKSGARQGQSAGPPDYASMTEEEVRTRIISIDATERKIGLAGSVLAAIFALVFTIPYMVSKIAVQTTTKPLHKTCPPGLTYTPNGKAPATCNGVYPPSHYVLPLVVWLIFAVAIYVTVRIGRRSPLAFALALTGLSFGTIVVIIPFVGAGAWILVRAWRTQKYGTPRAKAPVEGYVRPPPRNARSARASGGGGGARSSPTKGAKGAAPQGVRQPPAPSKRYTPKAPPKKKPPPAPK